MNLSINTNLSSIIAQDSIRTSTNKLNLAIERMTTGFKINHAKDNAAGYSIITNMTTKINAYLVAEDNATMGLDMLTTASDSLDQISDMLTRLRDLTVQASNKTYGEQSLNAINAEANALVDEIERLYSTTEYNGKKIFKYETPKTENSSENNFTNPVSKRDTSAMTAMSTVDETQTLAAGTYSISTAEDLQKLATITNNGRLTAGSEFVLANDIDLSSISNWESIGIALGDPASGTIYVDKAFTGTFDGNGYSIKNLKDNEVGDPAIIDRYTTAGLFGLVSNAEIKNLGVENVDLSITTSTSDIAAGIVCFAENDITIDNCYTTGKISNSKGAIAGVLGMHCMSGDPNAEVVLTNTTSDIDLSAADLMNGTYASGLSHGSMGTITVDNCKYTGTISKATYASFWGVAYNGTFNNCYSIGEYVDVYEPYCGLFFMNAENVTLSNSYYKKSGNIELVQTATNTTYKNIKEYGRTYTGKFYGDVTRRNTDSMTKFSSVSASTAISNGTYSISTASELEKLATMANNGLITGGEFVLANDIDLNSYSNWTSIGTDANRFVGTFDGNGYVIKNLTCTTTNPDAYTGLFGYIENATISNLGIEDAYISGGQAVGTLVGATINSVIENCYATGSIESSSYSAGGLVGVCGGLLEISDSCTDVKINNSDFSAGGLVGLSFFGSANINNCFTLGDVKGEEYSSGIIGMQYCFDEDGTSFGKVTAVKNSFALGEITGNGVVSGILYSASNIFSTSVSNCYYNSEVNPGIEALTIEASYTNNAPANAALGATTAELTSY